MTIFFISRHPGAREWAQQQHLQIDRWQAHLHPDEVHAGDIVIGTLPINLAAEVCARGACYLHLALNLPPTARGQELSASDLTRFGAHLRAYDVRARPCAEAGLA